MNVRKSEFDLSIELSLPLPEVDAGFAGVLRQYLSEELRIDRYFRYILTMQCYFSQYSQT